MEKSNSPDLKALFLLASFHNAISCYSCYQRRKATINLAQLWRLIFNHYWSGKTCLVVQDYLLIRFQHISETELFFDTVKMRFAWHEGTQRASDCKHKTCKRSGQPKYQPESGRAREIPPLAKVGWQQTVAGGEKVIMLPRRLPRLQEFVLYPADWQH